MADGDFPIFPPRDCDKVKRPREEENSDVYIESESESSSSSSTSDYESSSSDDTKRRRRSRGHREKRQRSDSDNCNVTEVNQVINVEKKKVKVDRHRSKELRELMTKFLKSSSANKILDNYDVSFDLKKFELSEPKLDRSASRRLRDLKLQDRKKTKEIEKNLKSSQGKVIDIARPLVFMWALISSDPALKSSPLVDACLDTLKL